MATYEHYVNTDLERLLRNVSAGTMTGEQLASVIKNTPELLGRLTKFFETAAKNYEASLNSRDVALKLKLEAFNEQLKILKKLADKLETDEARLRMAETIVKLSSHSKDMMQADSESRDKLDAENFKLYGMIALGILVVGRFALMR